MTTEGVRGSVEGLQRREWGNVMKVLALTAGSALALCGLASANVSISSKPTSNMSCDAGVCTATARKAVLNVTDLANMLAGGDVAVKTGSVAKDIDLDQPLTWSSTSRLTLDAQQSVTVKKQVTVAGTGALTLATNDGRRNGQLSFTVHGRVSFADVASELVINGRTYRLVRTVRDLAVQILRHPQGDVAFASDYDATMDGVYPSSPVTTPFSGVLNGLGNVVSHVFVSDQSGAAVGFFNSVLPNGVIANFGVGHSVLNGTDYVGGIAGYNAGNITDSFFSGKVRGTDYAGGIVGGNEGVILRAQSEAQVRGISAGGIAGVNQGSIDSSLSIARVGNTPLSDEDFVAGLVGVNTGTTKGGTIVNCYALGNAKARGVLSYVGGLVGYNPQEATILASYATGTPSAGVDGSFVGGFAGRSEGGVLNSYWDITTSGTSLGVGEGSDVGVTGLTDDELKAGLPAGFDPKVWGQSPKINSGYPYLLANPPR
jgi:hypothetical protein